MDKRPTRSHITPHTLHRANKYMAYGPHVDTHADVISLEPIQIKNVSNVRHRISMQRIHVDYSLLAYYPYDPCEHCAHFRDSSVKYSSM